MFAMKLKPTEAPSPSHVAAPVTHLRTLFNRLGGSSLGDGDKPHHLNECLVSAIEDLSARLTTLERKRR